MKPQRRFAPTGWPPWIGTGGRFQSEQLAGISGIGRLIAINANKGTIAAAAM